MRKTRRSDLDRRTVLTLGAGTVAGLFAREPSLAALGALQNPMVGPPGSNAPRGGARAQAAYARRFDAARAQQSRALPAPQVNGDERRYPDLIASYSKGLPHSALGEPDVNAFKMLVRATESGRAVDFEAVPMGGDVRQMNPQAAYAYTLEGPDPQALSLAPPPAFASAELAAEACELYWQALTRDAPFAAYGADPVVSKACAELSKLAGYRGPKVGGAVTPACLFRGSTPGDLAGPYVSQFLWKEVPYGSIRLVQQVRTATPGLDYMVTWDDWLRVQNGAATPSRHANAYRYVRSARDLAAYVQLDFTYQAFLTACLILFGMEGTTESSRAYKGAPYDRANPYRSSRTQSGFCTFGVAQAMDLLARVANLALLHAWHHKWLVHRWLRPEEFGGRLHVHRTGQRKYPIHDDILSSAALDLTFGQHRSYLLPQAYPEGCPLHPSYPAGHAVVAGACATVLKAFFDESFPIDEPVVARPDGLALDVYTGPALTVGGELDKLAANVSLARSAAGIHWRSDARGGLALGEAVALDVLREMRASLHEEFDGFSVTLFDGTKATA